MARACNIGRDDRNKGEAGAPTARPRESAPPSPCVEGGAEVERGNAGAAASRPNGPQQARGQEPRPPAPPRAATCPPRLQQRPLQTQWCERSCRPRAGSAAPGAAAESRRRRGTEAPEPETAAEARLPPVERPGTSVPARRREQRQASPDRQPMAGGPTPARHQRWCWRRHAVPAHSLVDKSLRL